MPLPPPPPPVSGFEIILPSPPTLNLVPNKTEENKTQISNHINKGKWGILIPYEIKNKHIIWGHQSLWSQQWEAPIRINGYRILTDMGDYIDKKNIENLLLNPDQNLDNITSVEDRYNADSLILLKLEDNKLDINVILPNDENNNASEDLTNNDLEELKQNTLQDLNSIYKNYKYNSNQIDTEINSTTEKNQLSVKTATTNIDFQELPNTNNKLHFSVVMDNTRMDVAKKMKEIIPSLPGVEIENIDFDNTGIEIIGFFNGDKYSFLSLLKDKGLPVGE